MKDDQQHRWAFSEAQYDMLPELRYFTSGQVPIEELSVYFRYQQGWPTLVVIGLTGATAYPLVLLFQAIFGIGFGFSIALVILFHMFLTWLLLGLVIPKLRQKQIRAALREKLRQHGIIVCRGCAYDLRGSPERCPECGESNPATAEAAANQ